MLKKLFIENYALIEKLEIDFSAGFSVITGETGAGKSILLGALSLILGQRADTSVLLDKDRKCIVEGIFVIKNYHLEEFFQSNELDYEDLTILRREINQNGKSRAFINDTPVNLNLLKELGDHLVNIHSQHTIITLNNSNFQLALLDDYAGTQNEIQAFRSDYVKYVHLKKQYEQLLLEESRSKDDYDYFQFIFRELESAAIREGEQEEMEQRLQILSHAEEIKTSLYRTTNILSEGEVSILNQFSLMLQTISAVTKFYPGLEEILARLRSNQIDLQDINSELERIEGDILFDQEEMDELTSRLDHIYKLEKKHHVGKDTDLIRIKNEFEEKLSNISSYEDKIRELKKEVDSSFSRLSSFAHEISEKRIKSMPEFKNEITVILHELGIPDAKVKVDHHCLDGFSFDGIDKLRFLFSSNKGVEMDDVSKIASGGELSRLMLSMKSLISRNNLLPTIIFDEIDMGVSGEVAGKVGAILKKMATNMQVIAITHLPQIAGTGDTHYWVYKVIENEVTRSRMKKLTKEERIHEIAKMLSSGKITPSASKAATELLSN